MNKTKLGGQAAKLVEVKNPLFVLRLRENGGRSSVNLKQVLSNEPKIRDSRIGMLDFLQLVSVVGHVVGSAPKGKHFVVRSHGLLAHLGPGKAKT